MSLVLGLSAQQDMMLYNIHGVPQSSYANPSNRFDGKFYIGLPGLSSNYFNLTNTVRYSDVIQKDGDSLLLSFSNLIDQMEDNNYLSFNSRIDLMSFGFNVSPSTQIIFNVTEVASFTLDYNKDMVRFFYEGNTAFLGTSPDLEGIGINATHYREYGLAASHQINEQWRVGARFKYLYGMENIYTERSDIKLITDPETYALTAQTDFKMHTSGLGTSGEDEGFMDYFSGRGNRGFGIDLGAFYVLNEKFSFSASIADLGFIRWNDFTKNYTTNGSYIYDGVDVDVFGDNELSDEDSPFDQILDSIENELGIVEGTGAYTSPLVTKVYLGGNYQINDRSFAGLLIKNDIFKGKVKPSFSLSYARKMTKWITLTGGYSALNGAYDNISMGAVFDPGPIQFYVMTDNILGMATPQNARNFHIRFGINLIFGRDKEELHIFNAGENMSRSGTSPIQLEEESMEETESETEDSTEGEATEGSEENTQEGEQSPEKSPESESSEEEKESTEDNGQETEETAPAESSTEDDQSSAEPAKDEATEGEASPEPKKDETPKDDNPE